MALAVLFVIQALCTGCAVVLSFWVQVPWLGQAALALVGGGVAMAILVAAHRPRLQRGLLLAAWAGTPVLPASLVLTRSSSLDCYHGAMAWLIALAVLAGALSPAPLRLRSPCRLLGMVWAMLGGMLWLVGSYLSNLKGPFFVGMLVLLVLLVLCHFWFRLPGWGIQVVNTCILFLVGLPVVDGFLHPAMRLAVRPDTGAKYYSYEKAKGDPEAFRIWWNAYMEQWRVLEHAIFFRDPEGRLPFRVRPRSQGMLFESKILMNSFGFRGKEFARDKGPAYRIVALGESTTFGCTLGAQDAPWPELLAELIRQRLRPSRPVEVLNAGLPSFNLRHNLYRWQTEILPLKPDLVISYHGLNGFGLLDKALPAMTGRIPPVYRQRPLKLLANCEYRLRVLYNRHLQAPRVLFRQSSTPQNLMDSDYARAYQELIQMAQTNGIRLVLANYSMAVNLQSDPSVVEFYSSTYPALAPILRANVAHSQLLQTLGREHPELCLVDTQAKLDGRHDKFIDLCHFTQEGRQVLAETLFAGMAPLLQQELGLTNPPPAVSLKSSPDRQKP